MATTLTMLKRTPYHTAFLLASDNGVVTAYDYTTTLAGFFETGPLKTLLAKLNANNALASLNDTGTRARLVRIRSIEGSAAPRVKAAARTIRWTANGLSVTASAGSSSAIEIRLADSPER